MKESAVLPGGEKISVINYQIETLEDSSGQQRLRLLIMKKGERRGVMILDNREEGEEIIARLNGGLVESNRTTKTKMLLRETATAVGSFFQTKIAALSLTSHDREKLPWVALVGMSWAVMATFLITRYVL